MKNPLSARRGENKKTFFIIGSILMSSLFLATVFCLAKITAADEKNISITEILYDPKGNNSEHSKWIELYNGGDDYVLSTTSSGNAYKINDFYVCDSMNDSGKCVKHTIYAESKEISFKNDSFLIISTDPDKFQLDYKDSEKPLKSALGVTGSKNAFVKFCYKDDDHCVDDVEYGSYNISNDEGYSLEKIDLDKNPSEDNWKKSCDIGGTPGQENSKKEDCGGSSDNNNTTNGDEKADNGQSENSKYAGQVTINEIYPAPNTKLGEKEFVEIKNSSGDSPDFSKWCLKDQVEYAKGNSGTCKKVDKLETDGDFSVFYGTFSLNNDSGGDTVYLSDENNNLVDSRTYASTKAAQSYAFDGTAWRWTSTPTPDAENQFDKIPKIKIKKDDAVYINMYAYFSVAVEDQNKDTKFTWDFGDGHKSYLQDTKHKYLETGAYAASLRVHDGKIDETLDFEVEVEKYKAPKIRIVGFSPNPKGSDTENEWIDIINISKKKVNLKGWSIATGWENFYNHPIRADFKIKPGKTEKLTRDICAFTLANVRNKLELRSPDGKTVQEIKYDHGKKSIAEDEIYQKNKSSWEWIAPPDAAEKNTPPKNSESPTEKNFLPPTETTASDATANQQNLGKYSAAPDEKKNLATRNNLVNYNLAVKFDLNTALPRVAGAATARNISSLPHRHWLIAWVDSLWMKINSEINYTINML